MEAEEDVAYSSRHIEQLLQCSICLDRFNCPKLLPCQHTYCLSPCLEQLVNPITRVLKCPECRADHIVPRAGPKSFPNNITIMGFMDIPKLGASVTEGRTTTNKPVKSNVTPPKQIPSKTNTKESSDEYSSNSRRYNLVSDITGNYGLSIVEQSRAVCQGCFRSSQQLEDCRHCQERLCNVCCRHHMDDVKESIERVIGKLKRVLPKISHEIDRVGQNANQMGQQCECVKNEILDIFAKLITEVKSRKDILLRKVDSFLLKELEHFRIEQEKLEIKMASLVSFCDSTEEVMNDSSRCSDSELVHLLNSCQENSLSMSSFISSPLYELSKLNICFNANMQTFVENIRSFGEVQTSERQSTTSRQSILTRVRPDNYMSSLSDSNLALPRSSDYNTTSYSPTLSHRNISSRENLTATNDREERNTRPRNRRPRHQHISDISLFGIAGPGEPSLRNRRKSIGYLPQLDSEESSDDELNLYPTRRPIASQHRHHDRLYQEPENNSSPEEEHGAHNNGGARPMEPIIKYNQKGRAIARFGGRGNGQYEFTWPRGVAVSPLDDTIYVADSGNHRVQVFDHFGNYLKNFGSYGQENGEFDCLAGITVNNLGHIIVADRYNHRIEIFDHNCSFVTSFGDAGCLPGQLNYPWGIACDSMGFIYVCDKENSRIQIFQSNGTFVRCFGEQGDELGQLDNPQYIAVSPDHKIYISDSSNHRIQVFSKYGDYLFSFGTSGTACGEVKYPRGIAIDPQGFVVVADSGNNRVQIFRSDGTYYSMFGSWGNENGQFKGIEGVAILANGNIIICDRENHRLQIF